MTRPRSRTAAARLCAAALALACSCGAKADTIPEPVIIQVVEEEVMQPAAFPWELDDGDDGDVDDADLPVSTFPEIWAYLLDGHEDTLDMSMPLTDVGYFGAELNSYGRLINVPNPRRAAGFAGRLHLVVACNGAALTHFALAEGRPERERLTRDLLDAARAYDGLQIDFENVPAQDGEAFRSFLKDLRAGLDPGKIFSVALRARTSAVSSDPYDYARIVPLVDRILVMAYDEHWSTSEPGPIASMDWCRRVAAYALSVIGREKLIMGLPFYGRTWGDTNPNRAFYYSGIERIKGEQGVTRVDRADGIPFFVYETPLTVTVYYEDARSLTSRLAMYRGMGVGAVGFWCLGQETPAIWPLLRVGE